jgi:hypothetical protein
MNIQCFASQTRITETNCNANFKGLIKPNRVLLNEFHCRKKDNINMSVSRYVIITAMKTFKKNTNSHDNADDILVLSNLFSHTSVLVPISHAL